VAFSLESVLWLLLIKSYTSPAAEIRPVVRGGARHWQNSKCQTEIIARTVLEDIWGGARRGLLRSSSLSQESSVVQLALRGT
jgi:hypothetical protein